MHQPATKNFIKNRFNSRGGFNLGSPISRVGRGSGDLRAVTSTIAIAAAISLGGLVSATGVAFAGSCVTVGAITTCSGPGAAGDSGYNIIFPGAGTVTTTPGFGLTNATGATWNDAFYIRGTGDLSFIDLNASVISGAGGGIDIANTGTGSLTVTSNGSIAGNGLGGIYAYSSATSTTATITVNNVTAAGGVGVWLSHNGTGNAVVSVNDVTATDKAILVQNNGAGSTTVTATGDVKGGGTGIAVTNGANTTGLVIDAGSGDVLGGDRGIYAINNGQGAATVTSTGTLTGGIDGLRIDGYGTDVTVSANDTKGSYSGIAVNNYGSGVTNITSTGQAVGGSFAGIYAVNQSTATDMTINAVDTTGYRGIFASNLGTGGTTVTSSGTAIGAVGAGLHAEAFGTFLTISANNTTGGQNGIYAEQHGTGLTTITSTGLAEGSTDGIRALTAGTAVSINNSGTVRNSSGASSDLAIFTNGSSGIINSGLITGTVTLSNLGNDVRNSGTWNTAGGTNEFGTLTTSNSVNNTGTIIAANNSTTSQNTVFRNVGTFNNGGLLTLGDQQAGDITTINGNYAGYGGTVVLDTQLGGDSSLTDRLVITGNATGSTTLAIRNAGGLGAQTNNGIEVVTVGGTSDADAFRLANAVSAGAFDYGLYLGGTDGNNANDWFLRSTNAINASSQTSLAYSQTLANYADATLGTLQQRTGNRFWSNGQSQVVGGLPGAGAWGRIGGQYFSADPVSGSAFTQSLGFIQGGYEGVVSDGGSGDLTLGGYVTVGTSRTDVDTTRDPVTGALRANGKITTTGYGIGGNLTWLGNDGFYADSVVQLTWYDSNLSNKAGGNDGGWSSTISQEVGKRFDLGSDWSIVPQAQLAWTYVDFDSFTDENGAAVSMGKGDSLKGRLGIRFENVSSWKSDAGTTERRQVYAITNLSYQFLNGVGVDVDGTSLTQDNKRLWGEIGAGGSYAWNDKASVFAEASYGHALASGNNYTAKGTVGFNYKW